MTSLRPHLLACGLLLGSVLAGSAEPPQTIDAWVAAAQDSVGLENWWKKEIVQADIEINFGGKTIVDAEFTFEAHGPRAKMVTRDGVTIIFDGKTALTTGEPDPQMRFHVLTWPWFVMAPFKMKGEGITLSDLKMQRVRGQEYATIRQTFSSGMGDAPDDWYRFFIEPESKLIEWMQYIVTFGKSVEEANAHPSVIRYADFHKFDGVRLARDYTFYHWNTTEDQPEAEPKGIGTLKAVRFLKSAGADFTVPEGAREIPMP